MFKKITRRNMATFLEKYSTDKRVLDVGSGGSEYQKYFPNRLTVDIDPVRKPSVVADAHQLPFKDGEFDVILCTEVLEHVKDPFMVEREFWRVLSPGGTLILTTRFIFPIHDAPNDFWRFTKYGLKLVFGRWEIIELKEETQTISTLAVLLQRIAFQAHLRPNKPLKGIFLILAWFLDRMNWMVSREFGDIRRTSNEENILSSGYYLACKKREQI